MESSEVSPVSCILGEGALRPRLQWSEDSNTLGGCCPEPLILKHPQKQLCEALAEIDGNQFKTDKWERSSGGGGVTCVLQDGNVFEKAGITQIQHGIKKVTCS